jgi:hypothetical protein
MKYFILAALIASLAPPVNAATFKSVKEVHPIQGNSFIAGWSYEFYWSSPAGAPAAIEHTHEENCYRPRTPDGKLLFPDVRKRCFNTEAEARVDAQKEADIYEAKERQLGVSSATISGAKNQSPSAVRRLWQKVIGE